MKKSVLITGSSQGIGLGTLEYLAEKGFHVIGTAINEQGLDSLKKTIKKREI